MPSRPGRQHRREGQPKGRGRPWQDGCLTAWRRCCQGHGGDRLGIVASGRTSTVDHGRVWWRGSDFAWAGEGALAGGHSCASRTRRYLFYVLRDEISDSLRGRTCSRRLAAGRRKHSRSHLGLDAAGCHLPEMLFRSGIRDRQENVQRVALERFPGIPWGGAIPCFLVLRIVLPCRVVSRAPRPASAACMRGLPDRCGRICSRRAIPRGRQEAAS
jgi:hypothetical protein